MNTNGFDSRAIIATVAMWEDVKDTRESRELRLRGPARAGVTPAPLTEAIHL